MTTGSAVCGKALDGRTSMLVSGRIQLEGKSGVSFRYNFQSAEFDEHCDSQFDDTFTVVLAGPKGAAVDVVTFVKEECEAQRARRSDRCQSVDVVTSVKEECEAEEREKGSSPGMPDDGDQDYKKTGFRKFKLKGDVGSPASIAFVLTDVRDEAYSSVVGIDQVEPF